MMIDVSTVGRVVGDIQLKSGKNGSQYTRFSIAVPKGYGEKKRTVYLDLIAFDATAKSLEAAKVKRGSLIMISGDMDVTEYPKKDGTKGKKCEVTVKGWSYVGDSKNEENKKEKEKDSNETQPGYDEYYCGDDDDLPEF